MAAQKGRLLLLSVGGSDITTAQENTVTINNETVETTAKDTDGWRELLGDAGIQSMTVALSGVYKEATIEATLRGYAMDASINEYTITDEAGNTFVGDFQITSYSLGGSYNGAVTFDATLESAGIVAYTPFTP